MPVGLRPNQLSPGIIIIIIIKVVHDVHDKKTIGKLRLLVIVYEKVLL